MIFDLHAGQIANYRWGSHLARFRYLTVLETKSFPTILAAMSAGRAPWTNHVEFRSIVAMIHEIAHYNQDVTTGTGNWDFLTRIENMPTVFFLLKERQALVNANEYRLARYHRPLIDDQLHEMHDNLVFIDNGRLPENRKARLSDRIGQSAGSLIASDGLNPYLLENLLEADAVATTMQVIKGFKMTDEQWEIAKDQAFLWRFGSMPDVYTESLRDFLQIYEHFMGATLEELGEEYKQPHLATFLSVFSFLIDVACAYPSPKYFELSGKERVDFEPGLKYVRLLISMQTLHKEQVDRLWNGFTEDHLSDSEAVLLENCSFGYPSTREVYSGWAEYLAEKGKTNDNRLLKMREQNALFRAANADRGRSKTVHSLLEYKSNFIYVRAEGMVFHGSGSDYFDEAERGAYFADVTEVNRDMALCEYLVESEQFVCPLAEMQVCSAATTVCAEGIGNEQEFPHDGCLIRAVLEQSNLSLERLNMNPKLEHITEAYINKSEGDATKALQLALLAERGKEELEITGLDVLVFLGVKIALPILCSFAKDALYNKYKQIKTKKDAESAKAELLAHTEPLMAKVKKETVVTELTRVLTPEGIPEEKAKRIVEHCFNEVESDLGLENKSAASGKP